jgi:uncharacterized protein (DUF849 family)
MHVHVRDERDRHSLDVERYRAAARAILKRVGDGLVIQVTTESCGVYRRDQQMQVVRELCPEAVSVALREICPAEEAEADAADFYAWMDDAGIMAQHILYSTDDLARFGELRSRGVIPGDRNFLLFVLGRYASDLTGDPDGLSAFIDAVPADCEWAVCCFGRTESAAVNLAAVNGGHARVGFENNLHLADGNVAANNAALIAQAAAVARDSGRSLATAADVRRLLAPAGQPK